MFSAQFVVLYKLWELKPQPMKSIEAKVVEFFFYRTWLIQYRTHNQRKFNLIFQCRNVTSICVFSVDNTLDTISV